MIDSSPPRLPRSIVFATDALDPLADLARAAERAGFDRVWTTEYTHRDAIARALAIALATDTIRVGTGIAYAFTRPPLAMAALALDVHRLSRNRFTLGLGSGTRGVRRRYGAEFEPAGTRMAEYAGLLREHWAANPFAEGSVPELAAAALNPIMTRIAARTFDAVLLHPVALARTHLKERLLPALDEGRKARGTPPGVCAWCITSIDPDGDVARERARRQLAFYLSTPSYGSVAEGAAWEAAADRVRVAFKQSAGQPVWPELATLLPDSAVDELTVAGTPGEVRDRVASLEAELRELGVTELVFQTVSLGLDDRELVASCELIVDALAP